MCSPLGITSVQPRCHYNDGPAAFSGLGQDEAAKSHRRGARRHPSGFVILQTFCVKCLADVQI